MGFTDTLKEMFSGEEEQEREIEVPLEDLAQKIKEEKEQEIEQSEKRAREITGELDRVREKALGRVRELKRTDYTNQSTRMQTAIEDLKNDFCERAKSTLKDIEAAKDKEPSEVLSEYKEAHEKIQEVSYKQAAALSKFREYNDVKKAVRGLGQKMKRLKRFLEEEYGVKNALNRARSTAEKANNLTQELRQIKEKKKEKKRTLEKTRKKLKKKEKELEEHKESSKHSELEELNQRKKETKQRKKKAKGYIDRELSKLDRALRKFKHEEAGKPAETAKKLIEKPVETYLQREEIEDILKMVLKASEENRINLGSSLKKKVEKTKQRLDELEQRRKEIKESAEEIENLEKEIKEYSSFLKEEKNLKKQRDKLREKVEDREEELENLKQEEKGKKKEIKKLMKRVQREMNEKIPNIEVEITGLKGD